MSTTQTAQISPESRTITSPGGQPVTLTPAQWQAATDLSEADRRHGRYIGASVRYWLEDHRARPEVLGNGCILLEAWGMIVGIEPDGYTHS